MRRSSPLLVSPVMTTGLTVVIAMILLASNFTIINAQQQVQSDGDLTATLNGETFARGDSITVRGTVAEREGGSVVYVNILDPDGIDLGTYSATVTNDLTFTYGFVAGQLRGTDKFGTYTIILTYFPPGTGSGIETTDVSFEYVSGTPTTGTTTNQPAPVQGTTTLFQSVNDSFSIQVPDGWIIHDVDNTGSILLEEATQGYGILAQLCPENQQQGAVPTVLAKTVEMTYSTNFAPNETSSGYLISTATNATVPNLGMTKGYTIFYEGSDVSAAEPTIGFGSLRPLPPAVGQILDSFQLIAAPGVAQALAQQAVEAAEPAEGVEDDGDDDTEDNGDDNGTDT